LTQLSEKELLVNRILSTLLTGDGEERGLYEPLTGSYVKVRDARREGGNRTAPEREINLFRERRRSPRRRNKIESASLLAPPPGGLGAGVSFHDSLLHFRQFTAVYFYLVAPATIGSQPKADLLYMTSSNTAARGCEALLSFFSGEQYRCAFRIWDWAHPVVPGGGNFVKNYTYEEIADYLIPYHFTLDSGQGLDTACLYIVNVTRQVNGMSFQNEIYLQNHRLGTRDLMWSYQFEWSDKDSTPAFWWGPIFETFPNPGAQYALATPLGFNESLIVQDGIEYQLVDQNSTMTFPSNDGLNEVFRSYGTNSGLICAR
jgi:hypothetical protein